MRKDLYEEVANIFINRMCDLEGPNSCIEFLMIAGLSDNELEDLLFERIDIKRVREDINNRKNLEEEI